MYWRFFTAIGDIYKRNIRRKQNPVDCFFGLCAENFNKILDRRCTNSLSIDGKTQYLATIYLMLELDILQRNRYETMAREIYIGGYVSEFIQPFQQVATKQ